MGMPLKKQKPEPTRPGQRMTDHREACGTEALARGAPGCQTQGCPKNHTSSYFSFRKGVSKTGVRRAPNAARARVRGHGRVFIYGTRTTRGHRSNQARPQRTRERTQRHKHQSAPPPPEPELRPCFDPRTIGTTKPGASGRPRNLDNKKKRHAMAPHSARRVPPRTSAGRWGS